ncbi:MAG: SAM-dependent methyltransferase [Anaerolineales bacterium]|jgi:methyltransferase (TIGR00027 family)
MRKPRVSRTAKGTAGLRAIESLKPAGERICFDPLARSFIDTWFYAQVKLSARFGDWSTRGGSTFVVCRTRFIDDYLQECLETGTAQVVILGAGLDSRAYRPPLLGGAVKTFEVDHPATQAAKMERVQAVLGNLPASVIYVPVDLNSETLDKLLASGFDRSAKTLFIWEGVTLYLQGETIDAALAWVRENACPGSVIIFDYQDTSTLGRRNLAYVLLNRLSAEERVFGIEKGKIGPFLQRRGFTHMVNADADEINRLYCTGANAHRRAAAYYSIVHAEVGVVKGQGEAGSLP